MKNLKSNKPIKFKNYLKFGIVSFGVSLFLWNCQKEDIINSSSLQKKNTEIQTIQQKFTLENYQDSFIKNNLKVNWNDFVNSKSINAKTIKNNLNNVDNDLSSNNTITYEFSTNIQSKISSTKADTAFYSKTTLFATIDKMSNSVSFKIIRYSSPKIKNFNYINLKSLDNYNGSIISFDLNGEILKMEAYKKGGLIQSIKNPSSNSKTIFSKAPNIYFDTGTWVMALVFHYKDWYRGTTNPITGKTTYIYKYSLPDGISYEWVYVSTGHNGGGTYHSHLDGSHGPSIHTDNHPNEIIKDNSFLSSKANCVYDLLIKQNGLKNILAKLLPENSKYRLTLKVTKDLRNIKGDKDDGKTTGNYDTNKSDILIEIDKNFAETASFPYLAMVIIHEAIHAKLFEMVKSVGGLNKLNEFKNEPTEFGKLWAYYDKYGQSKGWQHELMYGNYLNTIGNAVENFHKTYYLDDYNKFQNYMKDVTGYNKNTFYQDIAAYGLRHTTQFSKSQLDRINLLASDLRNLSTAKNCK